MEAKVYYLTSNSSLMQVRTYLRDNSIAFSSRSMLTNPLSKEELFEILRYTESGVEDILSVRTSEYHMLTEQGVNLDDLPLTELHKLIERYPRLLRSPILVARNTTMVGYNESEIKFLETRKSKKDSFKEILNSFHIEDERELQKLYATV